MLRNTCRNFHITFSRVYRSDGITTNMDLVRSGTAVGLGPQSFASYYQVSAVPSVPGDDDLSGFYLPQEQHPPEDIQQFRDHLLAVCRERRKEALERRSRLINKILFSGRNHSRGLHAARPQSAGRTR